MLYRPHKLAAMLQSPEVLIDGIPVCDLANDSYCSIELIAGRHYLTVDTWVSTLNRGTVLVDLQAAQTLYLSYDIEDELKWGTGLSILGKINAAATGEKINLLSWLENEDKLLVHPKTREEALVEIAETRCANCYPEKK